MLDKKGDLLLVMIKEPPSGPTLPQITAIKTLDKIQKKQYLKEPGSDQKQEDSKRKVWHWISFCFHVFKHKLQTTEWLKPRVINQLSFFQGCLSFH